MTSPVAGEPAPVPAVVTGTFDDGPDGSGVASVVVNGLDAALDLEAGTWRVSGVPLDPDQPTLTIEKMVSGRIGRTMRCAKASPWSGA